MADRRLQKARESAFGTGSVFNERQVVADDQPVEPAAPASLDIVQLRDLPGGPAAEVWANLRSAFGASAVPRVAGLANTAGRTCFANAVLQVLLRLPAVAMWLCQHARVCDVPAACLACAVWRCREAFWQQPARVPYLVRRLREFPALAAFGDEQQHDAEEFCAGLLDALCDAEVAAGRSAEWRGAGAAGNRGTHVERLFGFVLEQRFVCTACPRAMSSAQLRYDSGRVYRLPLPARDGDANRVWTVTELYYQSAAPTTVEMFCGACAASTSHREQSRLLTAPNVLLLHVQRCEGGAASVARPSVQPEAFLTLPGLPGRYDLAAVIYPVSYTHLTLPTKRIV